jgi:predicted enzyme related to lactoylglutathione lyase
VGFLQTSNLFGVFTEIPFSSFFFKLHLDKKAMNYSNAFGSYSVDDIAAARKFYSETLGLNTSDPMGMLSLNLANENTIFIYPKPDHKPATFTVLNFRVENLEKEVDALTAKGVKFEQYDNQYIKTDSKGIAAQGNRKMAWLKDPAGNFLGLLQE